MFLSCAACAAARAVTDHSSSSNSPYVLYDERGGGDGGKEFSLCLGSAPSDTLRDSLLMCRELSYAFCVNSSLIGSVLHENSSEAEHFKHTLREPTVHNVEQLAWLVDAVLIVLYQSLTSRGAAHLQCAHEWRAWVCSRAFRRAAEDGRRLPLPLCADTCARAEQACNTDLQCSARHVLNHTDSCTDFLRDSNAGCASSAASIGKTKAVPVFHDTFHYTSGATAAATASTLSVYICTAAMYVASLAVR